MKGVYIAASLGGVGTVGGASAFYFYKGSSNVETLRSRFAEALIGDSEDTLWNEKWKVFKKGPLNSNNSTLKLALSKKGGSEESEGKKALKKGCKELYDFPFKDRKDKSFLDFKSFCSKNNKEKAGGSNWITQDHNSSPWPTKLSSLKSHVGDIDEELKAIKEKAVPAAKVQESDVHRQKEMKEWCDKVAEELFEAKGVRYENFLTYCRT